MKYNQNPQERTPSTDPGTRTTNSHELPLPPAPKTGMGRSLIYYCTQNLLRMDSGPHFVLGAHASDCRQRPSEAPQPGDRETRSWATKGPLSPHGHEDRCGTTHIFSSERASSKYSLSTCQSDRLHGCSSRLNVQDPSTATGPRSPALRRQRRAADVVTYLDSRLGQAFCKSFKP